MYSSGWAPWLYFPVIFPPLLDPQSAVPDLYKLQCLPINHVCMWALQHRKILVGYDYVWFLRKPISRVTTTPQLFLGRIWRHIIRMVNLNDIPCTGAEHCARLVSLIGAVWCVISWWRCVQFFLPFHKAYCASKLTIAVTLVTADWRTIGIGCSSVALWQESHCRALLLISYLQLTL